VLFLLGYWYLLSIGINPKLTSQNSTHLPMDWANYEIPKTGSPLYYCVF
jgi:hypothetical protein